MYHINNSNENVKNNITVCPVCDGKHRGGIVRTFNLQKDETTAILGQINLESIYEIESGSRINEDFRRQLIAFSDSVPQATFYALFM